MSDSEGGYPGSQGRNWSPAETIDDYMRNCREGLEIWSDRQAAKLLGMNRMQYRKALLLAELPDELFEALLEGARQGRPRKRAQFRDLAIERLRHARRPERPHFPSKRTGWPMRPGCAISGHLLSAGKQAFVRARESGTSRAVRSKRAGRRGQGRRYLI
jgi:hypothetical protein